MIRTAFAPGRSQRGVKWEANDWLERQAQAHLSLGKTVGVLGGDHLCRSV